MKFDAIVRTYIRKIRPRAQAEIDWFADQPSLADAIEHAGLAQNSRNKRYSHQRRLTKVALKQALRALREAADAITRVRNFDELFNLIKDEVESIPGIGELYIYDTSLRIGAKLNLFPNRIYLHAGTRDGARALGMDHRAKTLKISALPKQFHVLQPHELEDILCIFKKELKNPSNAPGANNSVKRSWCH
jgi:hypothetical protein